MDEHIHVDDEVELSVEGRRNRFHLIDGFGDPLEGTLSTRSPIGSALVGRQIGEEFQVTVNGQTRRVRIVSVQYGPRYEVLIA